MLTPDEVRAEAVSFARWAVGNSEAGVAITSDTYRAITQGRHDYYRRTGNVAYSSCGDLPHAVRYALGLRRRVNRANSSTPKAMADGSISGWRIGVNISLLSRPGNPYARPAGVAARFLPGDILIVDDGVDDPARKNGAATHALVVLSHEGDLIVSAEYGQPGGALRQRTVTAHGGQLWLSSSRRVWSWLDLVAEYEGEAAAGQLAAPEAIPSPPSSPAIAEQRTPEVLGVARPYVSGPDVLAAQRRLVAAGFDCGQPDGYCGPRTTEALAAYALRELGAR